MALSEWTSVFLGEAKGVLHGDTWKLRFDPSIQPNSPEPGWKEYVSNTGARFRCTQCPRAWPSNRVMVIFHMRLSDGKGRVKVKSFKQSCNKCTNPPMVDPDISTENITILMKNLVMKIRRKCYKEKLDQGDYNHEWLEVNNPHEPNHCEGCKEGICNSCS
ncbi:receptor-transporting protein 3-like [Solea solea]|uniref:receptor-transporting protein 3-like n=1 Tax=Solea solea TaxID=90069 RepID=UPI00272B25CE|nr:receptor-transporting protein 3-like [Solea solea]